MYADTSPEKPEKQKPVHARRPRVYVPNRSRHDFSAAERFGDLVFITRGLVEKTETAQMDRLIEQALADSEPTDYILPTSLSIISCLLSTAFVLRHGRVNYLIYHKESYIPRTLRYVEEC